MFLFGRIVSLLFLLQMPQIFKKSKTVEAANKAKIQESFDWLEQFLAPSGFAAGTGHPTLADFSLLALVSTYQTTKDLYVDWNKVPKVNAWADKVKKAVPNYAKADGEGATVFEKFFQRVTGMLEEKEN